MTKRVRLGQLRKIKLPPEKDNEPDLIKSVRINQNGHHPDGLVLYVPDEMAEMIPKATPAESPKPAKSPKPDAGKDPQTPK